MKGLSLQLFLEGILRAPALSVLAGDPVSGEIDNYAKHAFFLQQIQSGCLQRHAEFLPFDWQLTFHQNNFPSILQPLITFPDQKNPPFLPLLLQSVLLQTV